jgi:hypothetical protein
VLVFASRFVLQTEAFLDGLRGSHKGAFIFGCSTAGEILDTNVRDESASLTAIKFDSTTFVPQLVAIDDCPNALDAGKRLARALPAAGLVHVLVLSDGVHVNGSELVKGLVSELPESVTVTGGLSGDGDRFEETVVVFDGEARSNSVGVIGLYGEKLGPLRPRTRRHPLRKQRPLRA